MKDFEEFSGGCPWRTKHGFCMVVYHMEVGAYTRCLIDGCGLWYLQNNLPLTGIVCEYCAHPITMTQVDIINKRLKQCEKCKSYMRESEDATAV